MSDNAPTAPASEPKGGAIIADRYQVDRLIARGGMATVYLAHHVKLNRPVALKILSPPPDAEDSGAFEERFRLEAETLAGLDHRNIVILHDFGELPDGRFYLAMEYIEGPRLSDVLRDGPLPPDRALSLIIQVCQGLRYAHKRGVVHRDLKPSNLLIKTQDDETEQVKVVDFGLVKLTEAEQSITRAGLILGSPHCMAPEQVKGLSVDHRADIYAIGVLLFRTLTGQYPFHGPNSAATMIAHLNQPVPTFFSMAPELSVPDGLEDVVRTCLAKNPADRFPDMKDVMDAMAACMEVPPEAFRSVSQSHSTIQRQAPVGGGSVKWVAAAVFAGVLLLGTLGVGALIGGGLLATTGGTAGTAPAPEVPVAAAVPAVVEPVAEEPAAEEPVAEEPEAGSAEGAAEPAEAEAEPEPEPEPTPAPAAAVRRPRPAPAPTPPPAPAAEEPAAEEPATEPEADAPEGYMGMPDDLFE